jgi:hypothetical protein
MAGQPEPLRLFDVGRLSHCETPTPPVSIRDTSVPIRDSHGPQTGADDEADDGVLRRAAEAARLAALARTALGQAIVDARAAGHSWRAIGIRTGIPYQTLHHGYARSAQGQALHVEQEVPQ